MFGRAGSTLLTVVRRPVATRVATSIRVMVPVVVSLMTSSPSRWPMSRWLPGGATLSSFWGRPVVGSIWTAVPRSCRTEVRIDGAVHGAQAEVLAPVELRDQVADALRAAAATYWS